MWMKVQRDVSSNPDQVETRLVCCLEGTGFGETPEIRDPETEREKTFLHNEGYYHPDQG